MQRSLRQNGILLLAVIAIAAALLCLLAPHSPSGHGPDWVALLPLLFVGDVYKRQYLAGLQLRLQPE